MNKLEQMLERVVDKVRPRKITESEGVRNIKLAYTAMKETAKTLKAEKVK